MSELQVIQSALQRAGQRQRWQQAWRGFWRGFLAGAAFWLGALAAYKLLPLSVTVLPIAGALAAGLALVGLAHGYWRGPSLLQTARWVDLKEHCQERLSTALEVSAAAEQGRWQELLVADAARHAAQLDPRRMLPFHLPKATRWALVVLAVGAGLGFVPEYRSKAYLQKQRDAEVIRDTGRALTELTRRTLIQHPPVLPAVRQNLESITNLGEQLSQAKLTRADALRDLASVTDKLKQETRQLAQNPALKRLEQAARTPSGKTGGATPDLQKKVEAMQSQLEKEAAKQQALDELQKNLEKAREAAAGLANKDSSGDAAARNELSKALAAMAQKAHELGMALPALNEAIDALAADQTDLLMRDLQAAMTDLEKMKDLAQKMEALRQQAERLGKDLAEQLEKGQATAAKNTLDKMVNLLKTAELKPEQLKAVLDEVAKAVTPAAEYGKVAEHLKRAVGQMQQNQRPGAAQSLADAAKELEKLLGEMGDMEALKATLAALGRAQMCIGNGECWGQNLGRFARAGRNRTRGGRGFGTWADEEGWLTVPEMSDLWENPPDNRGTLDPRSNTDRGDGQLSENVDPTRLRGKISPGGSMPSITLKGVSIKGLSTVQFQEAAMAAQSAAQNALSQEQIPRAYQGAVKDYFDDLKK